MQRTGPACGRVYRGSPAQALNTGGRPKSKLLSGALAHYVLVDNGRPAACQGTTEAPSGAGQATARRPHEVLLVLDAATGMNALNQAREFHKAVRLNQARRHQATKNWQGRQVIDELAARGILIRSPSARGVAEEAPGAYKDVSAVVEAADHAHLARMVARLEPVICVKG